MRTSPNPSKGSATSATRASFGATNCTALMERNLLWSMVLLDSLLAGRRAFEASRPHRAALSRRNERGFPSEPFSQSRPVHGMESNADGKGTGFDERADGSRDTQGE